MRNAISTKGAPQAYHLLGGALGADCVAHGSPYVALTTFCDRRQRVHTRMCFVPPLTATLTRCRFARTGAATRCAHG